MHQNIFENCYVNDNCFYSPQSSEAKFSNSVSLLDFSYVLKNDNIRKIKDKDTDNNTKMNPLASAAYYLDAAEKEMLLMSNLMNLIASGNTDDRNKIDISKDGMNKTEKYMRTELIERKDDTNVRQAEIVTDLQTCFALKAKYLNTASNVLKTGSNSLEKVIGREHTFFRDLFNLRQRWKIIAPLHGPNKSPLRSDEPLAVDCSFMSGT